MAKDKPKVLCLPGFFQNGELFRRKTIAIERALNEDFELIYLDPPKMLKKKDAFGKEDISEEQEKKWKFACKNGMNRYYWSPMMHEQAMADFREALVYMKEFIEKKGPFIGIIGYSQGAALSAILTNYVKRLDPKNEYFQFSIIISGFRFLIPKDKSLTLSEVEEDIQTYEHYIGRVENRPGFDEYYETSKDLPTKILFIMGENDFAVPVVRTLQLRSHYNPDNTEVYYHDLGHLIPKSDELTTVVRSFVHRTFKQRL